MFIRGGIMANKRSNLDVEISRVQKNTRNKIYRFRKKGLSEEDIAEIDPRRSTKGMTTAEKRAYLRQLQTFNGRETGYTVGADYTGNVGAVPTSLVREYQREQRRTNELKRKTRDAAMRRYGNLPVMRKGEQMSMDEYNERFGQWVANSELGYDRGYMAPVVRQYGFSSVGQVKRAIESQRRAYERVREVDRNLANYKQSIINKMGEEGAPVDVITRVRNLTLNQLQYIYYNTDFASLVSSFHYQSYYDAGYIEARAIKEASYDPLRNVMDAAQRLVPSTAFRPLVRD